MAEPSAPGSYVGEHQNGYFWNGTSWDQGETLLSPSVPTGTSAEELFKRQVAASSNNGTPAAPSVTVPATVPPRRSTQADAFISKFRSAAEKISQQTGIPTARILAQAGFESGWNLNPPGNNFFGVKAGAGYEGKSQSLDTHEADASGNLVPTKGNFRVYKGPEESFADWAKVIQQDNYKGALDPNLNDAQYATALQQGGYGTDPNYAAKLHGAISTTREGLGQAPDGSTVTLAQAPTQNIGPGAASNPAMAQAPQAPYAPPAGLLAQQSNSADLLAAQQAAAKAKAQEDAYGEMMKTGTGLLGQAETPGAPFMQASAQVHRPQAQPVAMPDFTQILAQQRLMRGT